jgi:3-deoxy-D-manno-octulosonic-acid transferase
VASAFLSLRKELPHLRLVIAPRHVERRASLTKALQELGLTVALRSEDVRTPADILLLDTTGELSRWYSLATVVIVGKSLPSSVNRGGQNMIEPLQSGRPVLIGPHTGNFEPLASRLCEAGAGRRITDADSIIAALRELLPSPARRQVMILAATKILAIHQGATERNCELVEKLIESNATSF